MEEGGVANQRIPPRVDQVPIVGLEKENEKVPLKEPQVSPEPQKTQVSPRREAPFVERHMTNADLRASMII